MYKLYIYIYLSHTQRNIENVAFLSELCDPGKQERTREVNSTSVRPWFGVSAHCKVHIFSHDLVRHTNALLSDTDTDTRPDTDPPNSLSVPQNRLAKLLALLISLNTMLIKQTLVKIFCCPEFLEL